MDEQTILNALSEAESSLFYVQLSHPTDELKAAHEAVRAALVAFAKEAGCFDE